MNKMKFYSSILFETFQKLFSAGKYGKSICFWDKIKFYILHINIDEKIRNFMDLKLIKKKKKHLYCFNRIVSRQYYFLKQIARLKHIKDKFICVVSTVFT